MGLVRGTGEKKFSKRRTDIDVPATSRPTLIVSGLSYVGSADIDNNNPENLYFHIFGQLPQEIKLYIFGERFNQNFYTEIGLHNHDSGSLSTNNISVDGHQHGTNTDINHGHGHSLEVSPSSHKHGLVISENTTASDDGLDTNNEGVTLSSDGRFINNTSLSISGSVTGTGTLNKGGQTGNVNSGSTLHAHSVTSGVTGTVGLNPGVGSLHTAGSAKQFFDDMKIALDGIDKTSILLTQASLAKFGDGTSGHTIVTTGVVLDITSLVLTPGQHKLTFSLNTGSPNNGGKVRYNLYLL